MVLTVVSGTFTYNIVCAFNGGIPAAYKELAAAIKDYTTHHSIAKANPETVAHFAKDFQPANTHGMLSAEINDVIADNDSDPVLSGFEGAMLRE